MLGAQIVIVLRILLELRFKLTFLIAAFCFGGRMRLLLQVLVLSDSRLSIKIFLLLVVLVLFSYGGGAPRLLDFQCCLVVRHDNVRLSLLW